MTPLCGGRHDARRVGQSGPFFTRSAALRSRPALSTLNRQSRSAGPPGCGIQPAKAALKGRCQFARFAEGEGSRPNPTMRPPYAWQPSPGGPALLCCAADQIGAANSLPFQPYCPWSALTHPTTSAIVLSKYVLFLVWHTGCPLFRDCLETAIPETHLTIQNAKKPSANTFLAHLNLGERDGQGLAGRADIALSGWREDGSPDATPAG